MHISIIIPTYNRLKKLNKFLSTLDLFAPEDWHIEVIIIDNYGNLTMGDLSCTRAKLKLKKGLVNGPCQARNLAVQYVSQATDWIWYADDDVELLDASLFYFLGKYANHGNIYTFSMTVDLKGASKLSSLCNNLTLLSLGKDRRSGSKRRVTSFHLSGGNFVIHYNNLKLCRWDERYNKYSFGEDLDFGLMLRSTGLTIYYEPAVTFYHNQDQRVINNGTTKRDILGYNCIMHKHFKPSVKSKILLIVRWMLICIAHKASPLDLKFIRSLLLCKDVDRAFMLYNSAVVKPGE